MIAAAGEVVSRKKRRVGDSMGGSGRNGQADNVDYNMAQISGKKVARMARSRRGDAGSMMCPAGAPTDVRSEGN